MTATDAQTTAGSVAPDDADGRAPRSWWVRATVVVLAVAFVAGVAGWRIGSDDGGHDFNDVDIGFLADMTTHHQGAISLGFAYLKHENDPVMGHIAREVVTTQAVEISTMNQLLTAAGDDADAIENDNIAMEWMGAPVINPKMPGMPTVADYEELDASSGITADDIFSRLMIAHHAAGVEMAEYAAEHGSDETVRNFAARVARNQLAEIDELNGRRTTLGLAPVDASSSHDSGEHGTG